MKKSVELKSPSLRFQSKNCSWS